MLCFYSSYSVYSLYNIYHYLSYLSLLSQEKLYLCPLNPLYTMYRTLKQQFLLSGIPEGEARAITLLLLEKVCGMSIAEALTAVSIPPTQRELLLAMAARVAQGEPVQYVLGEADFCGMALHVAPGVLIPRQETEELVGWIVEEGKALPASANTRLRVLDIGTGSGCIAIALAKQLEGAEVEAWDVSEEALRIAKENAEKERVQVKFERVDVLEGIAPIGSIASINSITSIVSIDSITSTFHLLVSNPPYIPQEEASEMEATVLDHEPHAALFVPNDDPLLFYRRIAAIGMRLLLAEGLLFFEINRRFGREVVALLEGMGYRDVELKRDAYGNDRMVKAIKP